MRPTLFLLTLALCAAAPLAQASVRMHLPHKTHHRAKPAEPANGQPAPTSDIPDPIWTSSNPHR